MFELPPEVRGVIDNALRIAHQIDAVDHAIQEMEAGYADIAGGIRKGGEAIGKAAIRSGVNSIGSQGLSSGLQGAGVGLAIAAAAHVIGQAVEKAGEAKAERERERRLKELLVKKKEIAAEKRDLIQQLLPELQPNVELIEGMVFDAAERSWGPEESERRAPTQEELDELFRGWVLCKVGVTQAEFLLAEFEAWTEDKQFSSLVRPDADAIRLESADAILQRAALPSAPKPKDVHRQLTEGAIFLLRDPEIAPVFFEAKQGFAQVTRALATKRAWNLLAFGLGGSDFKPLWKDFLATAEPVRTMATWRFAGLGAVLVLVLGIPGGVFGTQLAANMTIENYVAAEDPCQARSTPTWASRNAGDAAMALLRTRVAECDDSPTAAPKAAPTAAAPSPSPAPPVAERVAAVPVPAAGPVVYVLASAVNLRTSASKTADVEGTVEIATECSALGESDGDWARYRCGETTGWTKAALLAEEKPTTSGLLAQATASGATARERTRYSMRALALDPTSSQARAILWQAFFAAEHSRLQKILAGKIGGKREPRARHDATCGSGGEDCIKGALEALDEDASWRQVSVKDKSFVAVAYEDRQFDLRLGQYDDATQQLLIYHRAEYQPAQEMVLALQRDTPHPRKVRVEQCDGEADIVLYPRAASAAAEQDMLVVPGERVGFLKKGASVRAVDLAQYGHTTVIGGSFFWWSADDWPDDNKSIDDNVGASLQACHRCCADGIVTALDDGGLMIQLSDPRFRLRDGTRVGGSFSKARGLCPGGCSVAHDDYEDTKTFEARGMTFYRAADGDRIARIDVTL